MEEALKAGPLLRVEGMDPLGCLPQPRGLPGDIAWLDADSSSSKLEGTSSDSVGSSCQCKQMQVMASMQLTLQAEYAARPGIQAGRCIFWVYWSRHCI